MIRYSILFGLAIITILVGLLFGLVIMPPANYPSNQIYSIEEGSSLNKIARNLEENKVIRSPFFLKTFVILFGGPAGLKAGDYQLINPENLISLSIRFTSADYKLKPVKVTIPEGLNNIEINKILSASLNNFESKRFLNTASTSEGYLFPDTYNFLPNVSVETVVKELKANFSEKIKTVDSLIKASNKSVSDIIKMASILELEARTDETRRIVAGILWARLSIGMPLQVDASFKYINGKGTSELTSDDLKLNSPYNSYTNKGLPPTPISNPGLASIKAALTPIKTNYLYFLTDDRGNMHYAENYQKHLQNKSLYLK